MNRKRIDIEIEALRERAVRLLNESPEAAPELEKYEQADKLVQDIRIYHAELEIQNEELRRAQVQLEATRDHLYHLYHQAPVGYITLAKTGLIHEANSTAAKMFRIGQQQLLGMPISDIFHPQDRSVFFGRFKALMKEPDGKNFEIRIMRGLNDNDFFTGLIEAKRAKLPMHRDQGVENILLVVTDISDRKKAEEMLQLSDKIIASTHDAVLVTDAKARIISVNPSFCRTTGYAREEVIGKNPSVLQSGEQDGAFYQKMWKGLEENGHWQGVLKNRKKNGDLYSERLTITAIRDERGHVTHYVGIFSDISEQLSLEDRLLQSQKMEAVGTMVGGIAHDFNNILAGILGNTHLACNLAIEDEKLDHYLENIETLGKRATELIRNMLTFSRKGIVRKQRIDIGSFLADMVRVMGQVTIPESAALELELPEERVCVQYDKVQLQQLLLNLLANARDAVEGKADGRIGIRLHVEKSYNNRLHFGGPVAVLEISDNGCGMPQENVEHAFEPFFTTKPVGKGTGLGLSTVYGSVQSHGGTTHIASEVGAGTVVRITLPTCAEERPAAGVAAKAMVAGTGTILFADDEDMLRAPISELLKSMGYRVMPARDGKEALDLFGQHSEGIDLVIADVVMPHLGGHQLALKLREIDPKVPVIFITGYDREQVLKDGVTLDECEVLTKPLDFAELSHHISSLLDRKRAGS